MLENILTAIKSRVGVVSHHQKGQKVVAWNIANMWNRAEQMNEQVYLAMLSRGYTGEPRVLTKSHPKFKDWVWALFSLTISAMIILFGVSTVNEIIFELKDVHYSYLGKFPAVCGIDMTIRQGEKIAVIGANGTGKSTLLHLLDGLIFPDRGEVKAFGTPLTEDFINNSESSRNFRSKVGLVFQNADIQLFCPTVREDIIFGPLQLGVKDDEIKETAGCDFSNY